MWNGQRTQEALEGGVFARTRFLDVGANAEDACPYGVNSLERDAFKGKQFGTQAPKPLFDPKVKPVFEGEAYVDRMPYHELQPDKPQKGFLTSDFSKRDEFSMTLRAEQHRQQIKHEVRMQKLAVQKLAGRGTAAGGGGAGQQAAAAQVPKKEVPLLFDLVFQGDADLCIKAKRDTRNPTALSTERHMGPFKTTNSLSQAALLARSTPTAGAGAAGADQQQTAGSAATDKPAEAAAA